VPPSSTIEKHFLFVRRFTDFGPTAAHIRVSPFQEHLQSRGLLPTFALGERWCRFCGSGSGTNVVFFGPRIAGCGNRLIESTSGWRSFLKGLVAPLVTPWGRWLLGLGLAPCGVLLVIAAAGAGSLDVFWTAPTTNDDGSPLTELDSYRVYYGTAGPPCPGFFFVQIASSTRSSASDRTVAFSLMGLPPDDIYYVSVTAVDTSGNESACTPAEIAFPQIGFSVSGSVDFGNVSLDSFADQTFTVSNTAGGTVSGTASTSAPFSIVSGSPFNLVGVGATQTVTMRFSPTALGTAIANVNFTVNGDSISRIATGSGTDTTLP
jgi:hypothetical protein